MILHKIIVSFEILACSKFWAGAYALSILTIISSIARYPGKRESKVETVQIKDECNEKGIKRTGSKSIEINEKAVNCVIQQR